MNVTPQKLQNSDSACFVCTNVVSPKERVRIFKSGRTGSSSVDLTGLLNKTLDIDVNIYSSCDLAICIKCYKTLLKYEKAEKHLKEIKNELKAVYSDNDNRRVKRLHRADEDSSISSNIKKKSSKKQLFLADSTSTTCPSSSSSNAGSVIVVKVIRIPQTMARSCYELALSPHSAPQALYLDRRLKQRSWWSILAKRSTKHCPVKWRH